MVTMARLGWLAGMVLLPSIASAQPVALKRMPRVGETLRYRALIIFTLRGQDVVYRSLITDKITAVARDGGYTVETGQSDISATNGDRELPVDSAKLAPTVAEYGPLGEVRDLKGGQPEAAWRLARLQVLRFPGKPVAIGGTWSYDFPPVADRSTPGGTAAYKLVGMEKVGDVNAYVITDSYAESRPGHPASSTCKFWVDPATGAVLKLAMDWVNAPLLGFDTFANVHITYEPA